MVPPRPAASLPRLLFCPTVLLTLSLACSACSIAATASFVESRARALPQGAAETDVGLTNCDDHADQCDVGFIFADAIGNLYFYDAAKNNVKVVTSPGTDSQSVTVLPGPKFEFPSQQPYDGSVGEDGSLFLIADTGNLLGRFVLYRLPTDQTSWEQAEAFTDDRIGWVTMQGKRLPAIRSSFLANEPDGCISVFDGNRAKSPAVVVASARGFVPATDRVLLPVGLRIGRDRAARSTTAAVEVKGPTTAINIPDPGRLVGTDANGRLVFFTHKPRHGYWLRMYDGGGQFVGESRMAIRPIRRMLAGKDSYAVLPNGDVAEARVTEAGLEISRWVLEAR